LKLYKISKTKSIAEFTLEFLITNKKLKVQLPSFF
jgi:hypothetical protein